MAEADSGLSKFQRYRHLQRGKGQRGKGMKLLRVRVPDPAAPEFRAEAERQAALLHGAHEDVDALRFIEAAADWPAA